MGFQICKSIIRIFSRRQKGVLTIMSTVINKKLLHSKCFVFIWSFIVLQSISISIRAQPLNQSDELNKPVPSSAERMFKNARVLTEREQPEKAVLELKKVISVAPHFLQAHKNYIFIKIYHLDKYDEIRAEYETLLSKEPHNPVYLMALALQEPLSPANIRNSRFTKVTEIAPDWAWSYFAKAKLLQDKKPNEAVLELLKCIEKEPEAFEAYEMLLQIQEKQLGKVDAAISTAERMIANAETREAGLKALWRLNLIKTQNSPDSKSRLTAELSKLAASSSDLTVLRAIRWAYSGLLKDEKAAARVETKIKKLDPFWSKYRGVTTSKFAFTNAGLPRHIVTADKQSEFIYKIVEMGESLTAKEKMARLEEMLRLKPKTNVKFLIYSELRQVAEKNNDLPAIIKYGEALQSLDPEGSIFDSKTALAYAEQNVDLSKAMTLALKAEKATVKFEIPRKPINTNPDWIKERFPESWLQDNHKWKRSIALEALGWTYFQTGNYKQAEINLRQSSEFFRSEKNLRRLAGALNQLGRFEESKNTLAEAGKVFEEEVKARFIDIPSKDFELQTIDGRKIRLADLKGKVVLLNFWAAWCGGCVKEAPHLVELYDKYKSQGFEILAISTDAEAERYKVAKFVKDHQLSFPILYNENADKLYNVEGFPTNIFIDKEGKIKYQSLGYFEGIWREYDVVINELLK